MVAVPKPDTPPEPRWEILMQTRQRQAVYVRTSRSGRIFMSAAAYAALGSPKEVEVLLNRGLGRFGFRPAEAASTRTWRVNARYGNFYSIDCRRLLRAFALSDRPYTFPARVRDGILRVDIAAAFTNS